MNLTGLQHHLCFHLEKATWGEEIENPEVTISYLIDNCGNSTYEEVMESIKELNLVGVITLIDYKNKSVFVNRSLVERIVEM